MKYLCLVYQDEKKLDALSQSELDSVVGACMAWVEELEQGGHHVLSAGLQSVRTATTVRHRSGKLLLTDGPFAETTEFLGGFTLITARDLNEAIQLAAKFPAAHLGSMEVRPLLESDGDATDPIDRKITTAMRHNLPRFDQAAMTRVASVGQPALQREP